MAGIGFELKKIYGRKTLAANLQGTVYATMTTIGPAVLSAVLLLVLEFLLAQEGLTVLEERFLIAFTSYAFVIATLVSVLFAAPVSRYIADCIFLEQESNICPSAFGVLTLTTLVSGTAMLLLCVGMHYRHGAPMSFLISYYLLGVLVSDVYSMMIYASALKHYKALTFSFLAGFLLAVGVYFLLTREGGVDKVIASCMALVGDYLVILFSLVFQCVRAFGAPHGRYFAFLSYFRRYPRLAVGSFSYSLGIYCPSLIYWFFSGISEQVSIFHTAPAYDYAMFLSVFVNIPSLVIFVVKVETAFYEKYTLYVSALNNGAHELILKEREVMSRALRHQLFFVYEIQLIITVVLVCLVSVFFPYLNGSAHILHMFVVLSLGIYTVFCMYFTIIVFYYFSDYRGACTSSLVFLGVTALGAATAVLLNDFYPFPLLLGGLCGWVVAFLLLRRRMETLDSFLMC